MAADRVRGMKGLIHLLDGCGGTGSAPEEGMEPHTEPGGTSLLPMATWGQGKDTDNGGWFRPVFFDPEDKYAGLVTAPLNYNLGITDWNPRALIS